MQMQPLSDKILIKRDKPKEVSPGGLILPASKEKPRQGKVLAVGPGSRNKEGFLQAIPVKVGDTVLFSAYSGTEVDFEGVAYLFLTEAEVLATVS